MLSGSRSHKTTDYFQRVSILSFVIFVLTAWFSSGYHHPDEHFQILEFCNYKLGNISSDVLPWEFNEQIRPGLPIFIVYGIVRFFSFFGITDPFFLSFVLRLLTALLTWWIIRRLALKMLDTFTTQAGQKIFFAMILLLWFVPYTSVRFSSENLSSTAVLFALFLLLNFRDYTSTRKIARLIIAGFLLGFAFYFRFQIAFVIFGLGLWMLIIYKMKFKEALSVISGLAFAFVVCHLIDFWFYEDWVFSPINYFTVNIIEDVVSDFGVSPWWDYFYQYFKEAFPPLSAILLLFFFYGVIKNPRSIFLWCIVPFLIAHFMIGHKEIRFLFPIIFPFIYLASIGIDSFILTGKIPKIRRIIFILLLLVNVPFLLYRSFLPASENTGYQNFLYHFAADKKMELFCIDSDVYSDVGLPLNFYRSPNVTCRILENRNDFIAYLESEKPQRIYVYEYVPILGTQYEGYSEKVLYSKFPDWIVKVNINNWVSRTTIFKIKELVRI